MFILFRTITYATVFVGVVVIYLPSRFLSWTGIGSPSAMETPQIAGMLIGASGAALAMWCISTFVWLGKGTPAPFDPPRRLVICGPYRFVRNPMYIGGGLALAGASLFFRSLPVLAYGVAFMLAAHLFVMLYEEPTLRRGFGPEYEAYCHRVRRWWPGV